MADKTKKDKETSTKKKAPAQDRAEKPKKAEASAKASKKASAETPKAPKVKKSPSEKAAPRNRLVAGTFFAKPDQIPMKWKLIDATNIPLGRLSSYVASLLMGKFNPSYTRSSSTGDSVVVINAKKVLLTGNKFRDKVYQHHTNYPGGLKTVTARELLEKFPDRLVKNAVHGMLPKGHMGRKWYSNLRVYPDANHPHVAQQPEAVKLPDLGFWERA